MTVQNPCPRCCLPLVADELQECLSCSGCSGHFVKDASVHSRYFEQPVTAGVSAPLKCPICQLDMSVIMLGDVELDRCNACGGVWLDAGEEFRADTPQGLQRLVMYSLSLPERIVRSTVGVAAGAALETASLLVPQSFQSGKTYEIVVRNSLSFLTSNVGGVVSRDAAAPATSEADFMARKAAGNFVDLAGMATLHVSPLWFLAIVSDVAYGTKTYVQELAKELQEQGLIDDTSSIHHVDDVLKAIQDGSGNAASLFDTPPLSVDQLRETLDRTRTSLTSVDYTSVLPEAELRKYWEEMKDVSTQENVSLLGVSGALAMNTLSKVETVSKGTLTGIQVVGGLFNRHVIGHYVTSLQTIRDKGFFETVQESSAPYIQAVWSNFADDKPTWTEDVLSGKMLVQGWKKVTGWFGGEARTGPTK